MRLINRLIKLEEKQQNTNSKCYGLEYFYGQPSEPMPLIPNLSLAAFYNQPKEAQHG